MDEYNLDMEAMAVLIVRALNRIEPLTPAEIKALAYSERLEEEILEVFGLCRERLSQEEQEHFSLVLRSVLDIREG